MNLSYKLSNFFPYPPFPVRVQLHHWETDFETVGNSGLHSPLKMKLYSIRDEIITVNADLGSTQRCHFLSLKMDQEGSVETSKKKHSKKVEVNLVASTKQWKLDDLKMKATYGGPGKKSATSWKVSPPLKNQEGERVTPTNIPNSLCVT